jgi:hypothetical protein
MTQTKIGVGMINATSIGDAKLLQGDGAWVTPSASGLTFISSTDISSAATYAFTAVDASSYDSYLMHIHNLTPATDAVHLYMRTSSDGGSSYDSGGSDYSYCGNLDDIAIATTTFIELNASNGATTRIVGSSANEKGWSGQVWIHMPHLAIRTHVTWNFGMDHSASTSMSGNGTGVREAAADVDAWQLLFSSGDIESGTVNVYGLANA